MIRRSGFMTMVGGALIISSCGRQVTPAAAGTGGSGVLSGFMQVKFRVQQAFDFTNYSYAVVFNTTGDGKTPIASPQQNAYAGYSFVVMVSGTNPTALAFHYYRPSQGQIPELFNINPTPQNLYYTISSSTNTELTIVFNRLNLASYSVTNASPTPTASATATPAVTPSPSPSPSSSASPSPTPSPTPTPSFATTWNFNAFTMQGQQQNSAPLLIQDSLGQGGGTDTTYTSPSINTLSAYESGPIYPATSTNHPTVLSAAIASIDITSTP